MVPKFREEMFRQEGDITEDVLNRLAKLERRDLVKDKTLIKILPTCNIELSKNKGNQEVQ